MYTHCRQFPHLSGRSDQEIRALVGNGMRKRPHLIRIMKIRNLAVLAGMIVTATLLWRRGGPGTGNAMMKLGLVLSICGIAATALILLWNLVWVNTVLWKVTTEEIVGSLDSAMDRDQ